MLASNILCVTAILLLRWSFVWSQTVNAQREFRIDYENNQFLLDGTPFRYVSGSLHYFRVPWTYWKDRLMKFRAAGLNVVSTYVEWSQHEPSPGLYDFDDDLDLIHFLQVAEREGLLVILRVGPYICAERDMGGLPSWLLTLNPDVHLRSNDFKYTQYVERWLKQLMNRISPQLYGNGGPIIMVQVENEYGSYSACDFDYTTWLRDQLQSYVGNAAVLFTTDGNSDGYLKCGKIQDVYATVDFGAGANVAAAFRAMRNHEPRGPLVNSEFYPGWLTHWGEPYQTVKTANILKTLDIMLMLNASVNFYMFFGGTNFGFTSGANFNSFYQPQSTSYDYNAPLTEAGDPTEKYYAIRNVIGKYLPLPDVPLPEPSKKGAYGCVTLLQAISLLDPIVRQTLGSPPVSSELPLSFEQLGQRYGLVLYETRIPGTGLNDPALLLAAGVRDRAIVLVDEVTVGALSRARGIYSMPLLVQAGQYLQLLVENQGRINYGPRLKDFKGLASNVTLDGQVLTGWIMTGFPLTDISKLDQIPIANDSSDTAAPAFFSGEFQLPANEEPRDTFLNTKGWGKGVAFVNRHNLGRYWPTLGPQLTLYVPASYLLPHPAVNQLVILEMQFVSANLSMQFINEPIISK